MWRFHCLVISCMLLVPLSPLLGSDAAPRLFFKKEIANAPEESAVTHKVRQGEWLYEILRSYGFSDDEIPPLLRAIAKLNPHIRDLDNLQPGQRIYIPPVKPIQAPASFTPPPASELLKYIERGYTVRRGDTTVQILRQQAGVPEHLIFNEFLGLFQDLNPQLSNINALDVGQKIRLPVPTTNAAQPLNATMPDEPPEQKTVTAQALPQSLPQALPAQPPAAKAPPVTPPPQEEKEQHVEDPEPDDLVTNATVNRALTMAMLEKMGFTFAKGTEVLHPLSSGGWYRINVQQTPLGTSRWGQKILLVPEQNRLSNTPEDLGRDILLCDFPSDWQPRKVFERLEELTNKKVSLWPDKRQLILQRRGYTLELRGGFALVVEGRPRDQVYLFNVLGKGAPPTPSLLRGFLDRLSVHVGEWRVVNGKEPDFVQVRWPAMSALLTPLIPAHNAWPVIRPLLGQRGDEVTPASKNIVTVMSELQAAGLAVPKNTRFSFPQGTDRWVTVTAPAMELQTGGEPVHIFDSRHADPYLLALLTLTGKNCYAVSERIQ